MSTVVTCPGCAHQFEPTEAIALSVEKEMRAKMEAEWRRRTSQLESEKTNIAKREKELQQQQERLAAELQRQVEDACKKRELVLQQELSQKIASEYQTRLSFLEQSKKDSETQLQEARQKELAFLRREEELKRKEQEMELERQRIVNEERQRLHDEMRKWSEQRERELKEEQQMKQKEWEIKFEQQARLLEEAQRKAQQGSMQLQGEVQELALEELLRQAFPFDKISEVGKGVRGADCILTVRNAFGQECGCIIFESKRTQNFGPDWIDKLKNDMVSCSAEIAVLVSQVMPKDMDRFGEKQGVYICSFAEVKSLVEVLRQAILRVYEARKSQENKGDKMVMLYDYLTGSEFMSQWNTMRDSFRKFRSALQKEREDFEKNWKKKEKLLDVIISNSLQISGSIEGISGMESMNWTATLPEENPYMLD